MAAYASCRRDSYATTVSNPFKPTASVYLHKFVGKVCNKYDIRGRANTRLITIEEIMCRNRVRLSKGGGRSLFRV